MNAAAILGLGDPGEQRVALDQEIQGGEIVILGLIDLCQPSHRLGTALRGDRVDGDQTRQSAAREFGLPIALIGLRLYPKSLGALRGLPAQA